jgi:hypothetical protein
VGDTVLDPFLGSGTTIKAALDLERHGVGYEINETFVSLIEKKLGIKDTLPIFSDNIAFEKRERKVSDLHKIDYNPMIQDANPLTQDGQGDYRKDKLNKVIEIVKEDIIKIDNGNLIKFLGVNINSKNESIAYLNKHILGKKVIIKDQMKYIDDNSITLAYVYLKNKIFINVYLIKSGLGSVDTSINHRLTGKFNNILRELENA